LVLKKANVYFRMTYCDLGHPSTAKEGLVLGLAHEVVLEVVGVERVSAVLVQRVGWGHVQGAETLANGQVIAVTDVVERASLRAAGQVLGIKKKGNKRPSNETINRGPVCVRIQNIKHALFGYCPESGIRNSKLPVTNSTL
jgi:hypothetical protein